MNFGLIVRQALMEAELPDDAEHLEKAKTECNFIIQDLWYSTRANYRQSRSTINTVSGSDEYVLNKYFDEFVKYTLQGPSSNPRHFFYRPPEEFFRTVHLQDGSSGDPFIYTFGDMVGYDRQLLTSSKLKIYSSLANKTAGTVRVTNGSDRVTSSAEVFSLNDVGMRFRVSGTSKSYKIGKRISPTEIQLLEKYRDSSNSSASYSIGDVGVHVNISGYVSSEIESEDVELDGASPVNTTKTFSSLVSISKSDMTSGSVIVQSSDGTLTVGRMAGAETEIERQTVLLWPKPDGEEALDYRFFMKHPLLWLDTDRLLIPNKWHRLVFYILKMRLRESAGKDVPQGLMATIIEMKEQFENEAEDLSLADLGPDGENKGYGDRFFYDRFEIDYL